MTPALLAGREDVAPAAVPVTGTAWAWRTAGVEDPTGQPDKAPGENEGRIPSVGGGCQDGGMKQPTWLQREAMARRQSAQKRAAAQGNAIADMLREQRRARERAAAERNSGKTG